MLSYCIEWGDEEPEDLQYVDTMCLWYHVSIETGGMGAGTLTLGSPRPSASPPQPHPQPDDLTYLLLTCPFWVLTDFQWSDQMLTLMEVSEDQWGHLDQHFASKLPD